MRPREFWRRCCSLERDIALDTWDVSGLNHGGLSEVEAQNLVAELLLLLAQSGQSTHRVEHLGGLLCQAVGLDDWNVALLPTLLTVTFNGTSVDKVTRVISRELSPSLSLHAVELLDFWARELIEGRLAPVFLPAVVREGKAITPLYPPWVTYIATCVSNGAMAATFFGVGWEGVLIAAALGMVVMSPLQIIASKWEPFALIASPTIAVFSGFVVKGFTISGFLPRGCLRGVELASIALNAPGIALALSALELSSRSLVSGTARLVGALAVAFLIGLGLSFGEELATLFDKGVATLQPASPCVALSMWWLFLSFPLLILTNFILLDAPFRRWIVLTLVSVLAFWVSYGLTFTPLSSSVQTVLASLCVGTFASLYSMLTDLPSASVVFGGVILLVPGSLSIATFQAAVSVQAGAGGLSFGISFLVISVSVALGLLIASVPRFRSKAFGNTKLSIFSGANSLI